MLTLRQLDDAAIPLLDIVGRHEQLIINNDATLIGQVLDSGGQADAIVAAHNARNDYTHRQLDEMYAAILAAYPDIVDEAVTRSLEIDNRIYRESGLRPTTLAESPILQQTILAMLEQTNGEFYNLSQTTAYHSYRQFGRAVDEAVQRMLSGDSYQCAIGAGVRQLAENGLEAIEYGYDSRGRIIRRYMESAFRNASMTGVNQIATRVSLENGRMLGVSLWEVSAHAGARTGSGGHTPDNHAWWQGKRYLEVGETKEYPNLYAATGLGTGEGLGGWGPCRHSLYPVPDPSAPLANTAEYLRELNNKTVTYNGQKMPLDKATDYQRYLEAGVRRWKREASALAATGQDAATAEGYIKNWQGRLRDFTKQAGLRRDYFRERSGEQLTA